ncbi:hypothetical protein ACKKBG_A24735 [Auxenochlorella protothecoides x Auxenochlorella symbiontica]
MSDDGIGKDDGTSSWILRRKPASHGPPQPLSAADARRAARLEAEGDNRPRVVAYSDSDSDVESHIRRVKDHLLGGEEAPPEEDSADGMLAGSSTAMERGTSTAAAPSSAASALAASAAGGGGGGMPPATRHLLPSDTLHPGLLALVTGLAVLHRLNPGLGEIVEATAVAVPLSIRLLGPKDPAAAPLGLPLRHMRHALHAVGVVWTLRFARRALRATREARLHRRLRASASVQALERPATPRRGVSPESPGEDAPHDEEWVVSLRHEAREMRRMLAENDVDLAGTRFEASDAELLRYAAACGLREAQPAALRARAVDAAVGRVVKTLDWQARQRFTPLPRLRRWKRLVDWQGADGGERPILLVRAGRALQLLRPRRHAEFCDVVLSRVADGAGGVLARADRVSVVVDCRGAGGLRAAWCLPLVKNLATQLHQHFPERLHRLFLLEVPLLARWGLRGLIAGLPPATRARVRQVSIDNPAMPVTVAYLSKRRSDVRELGMRRSSSDLNLPPPTTPSAGGTPLASPTSLALDFQRTDSERERERARGEGGETSDEYLTPDTSMVEVFASPPDGPGSALLANGPRPEPSALAVARAAAACTPPQVWRGLGGMLQALAGPGRGWAPGGRRAAPFDPGRRSPLSRSAGPCDGFEAGQGGGGEASCSDGEDDALGGGEATLGAAGPGQLLEVQGGLAPLPRRGGAAARRLALSPRPGPGSGGAPPEPGPRAILTRVSADAGTPPRSVLRRIGSDPGLLRRQRGGAEGTEGRLDSYPLRLISSVSWAEELEHVREVMGLPASEAGETAGAQQAGQRQVTSFLLLTLVASFLQRVLVPA